MLTRSLITTAVRDFARRPRQGLLMILGIALGVAVVIAIDLANTSARRAFDLSTEAVTGRATHRLVGGPAGLPDELYRQVRVDWGLRASAPVVEGVVIAPDLDGQPLLLLGVDPIAEAPFRNFLAGAELNAAGFERFYASPDAVILSEGLARQYGLGLGQPIRLQIGERFATLTILGLLTPPDPGSRSAFDNLLLMDVGAAQNLLGQAGRLTRIDLIASPAEAARLAARLPADVRLAPASEQAEAVAQLTAAFQLNLTALSLLALVVGVFLIFNTITFSVVQRRAVFGILRTLGVTGGQLLALVLFEAAVVGLIGAVLGLGLGWLLGQGAVRLVTQTINDLYYVVSVREAPLDLVTALKGLLVGVGAGLLATVPPALEAASVEPITVMRRSAVEAGAQAWLPRLAWLGAAGIAVGVAVLLAIPRSLVASFGGLFALLIGLALLVPGATALLMRGAAPLLERGFGVLGRVAGRTITRAISRTGVAIAALMVAVSVTIGVSVMIASFRATVTNWLDLTLIADLYISAPSAGGTRGTASLPADLAARVAAVPGVAAVETIRSVIVESEFGPVHLSVTDSQVRRSSQAFRFAEGDPDEIWARLQQGAVIVSEPFAYRHNLPPVGGAVTLRTDRGDEIFPVVGIYYDYGSDQGTLLMSRAVYDRYWNDRSISGVAAYLDPAADAGQAAFAVRSALSGSALQVQANRDLRAQALAIFDRTFAITNALRLLAVIVAFIGVLSALMALQIERARELATLQALGVTGPQMWKLALIETGLMGASAGLFSIPTGFVLALVLVYVINLRSFGWTIQMEAEPWVYAQALVVSIGAALLAAIYPMRRLQQVSTAEALRQE